MSDGPDGAVTDASRAQRARDERARDEDARSALVETAPVETAQAEQAQAEQAEAARAEAAAIDGELMRRLGAQDETALAALYDRYSTLVFSVAVRVLHDQSLAEDVTQEVFLRLWRKPQSFDSERGRFLSWLMSVTRNRAIDEQRKRARRQVAEEPVEAMDWHLPATDRLDDPPIAADLHELRDAVRAALSELSDVQRETVWLAYFGGYTQAEIAVRTGAPLGTVKTRIRLALRKLRSPLAAYDEDVDSSQERPEEEHRVGVSDAGHEARIE